jgi:hypothetical protein
MNILSIDEEWSVHLTDRPYTNRSVLHYTSWFPWIASGSNVPGSCRCYHGFRVDSPGDYMCCTCVKNTLDVINAKIHGELVARLISGTQILQLLCGRCCFLSGGISNQSLQYPNTAITMWSMLFFQWQEVKSESAVSKYCNYYVIHRHLYNTCLFREVHTSLRYFWNIESMWTKYCRQFGSRIWTPWYGLM